MSVLCFDKSFIPLFGNAKRKGPVAPSSTLSEKLGVIS
jgi:hypothetical protein